MTDAFSLTTQTLAEQDDYMVRSRLEISYILRAIQSKGELVTAYFNHGKDAVLTSILAVDPDITQKLILDYGPDNALNQRMLTSEKIIFVTAQNGVRIQFTAKSVEDIIYLEHPAFGVAFPSELLRLQRREYFRLPTPVINPIKCSITFCQGGTVEVVVSDISLGGMAITSSQNCFELSVRDRHNDCRILLPGLGTITPAIEVRNLQKIARRDGTIKYRAGCMFLNLPPAQEATIQKYIIRLEQNRNA